MITPRRVVFFAVLGLLGAGLAAVSVRGEPQRRLSSPLAPSPAQVVTPAELAGWIVEGRRDFTVVDMRSRAEDRAEGRKAQADEGFVDLARKVVLYTQTGREPVVVPRVLHDNPRVLLLSGGYDGWGRDVLAPVDLAAAKSDEDLAAAKKRAAVRSFFTGEAASERPTAKLPVEPVRRTGPHKAGSAAEGC